jgi:hypothetical protein
MKLAAYGLVVLTLISCGPMNSGPASSKPTALTADVDAVASGTHGDFVFVVKPQASTQTSGQTSGQTSNDSSGKPVIGKNEYVIRLVHASDLSPVSKETQVSISYTHLHEKIPAPTPFTATVVPQADGSYLATVYFQKSGTWNLDIQASEPENSSDAQATNAKDSTASLKDDYSLSITL